jgi:hypothetical protein
MDDQLATGYRISDSLPRGKVALHVLDALFVLVTVTTENPDLASPIA